MARQVPSIGRMVHFVLDTGYSKGQHRPAIIVRVFDGMNDGQVNLQVFTDEANDNLPGVLGVTSAKYDESGLEPRTWHWMEYVAPVE